MTQPVKENRNVFKGTLLAILSAVIYGCMPMGAKLLYADGVDSTTLVFLRNALAVPALLLIVLIQRKGKLPGKTILKAALAGSLGSVGTPFLLYRSYRYIASGAATTIHYIYPVLVVLLCALLFKDKLSRKKLICLLLSTGGVALLYLNGDVMDPRGLCFASLSGLVFATYTVLIGKTSLKELDPFRLNLISCTTASVLLIPTVFGKGIPALPTTAPMWIFAVFFAVAVCVGAMSLFKAGTSLIGPQKASMYGTFEPLTSILMGTLVFSEPFGLQQLIGTILILSGVILLSTEK